MPTEQNADGTRPSITEIVLQRLCEERPASTVEEVLERAGGRVGGNFGAAEAVAAVRAELDSR